MAINIRQVDLEVEAMRIEEELKAMVKLTCVKKGVKPNDAKLSFKITSSGYYPERKASV